MKFIRDRSTKGTLINLTLIEKLVRMTDASGREFYKCITKAGDHVGDVDDLEGVDTRAVLPDTTGAVVVQFGLNADGVVNFFKLPFVAWKYKGHGGADPITVKSLSGVWCLELK